MRPTARGWACFSSSVSPLPAGYAIGKPKYPVVGAVAGGVGGFFVITPFLFYGAERIIGG